MSDPFASEIAATEATFTISESARKRLAQIFAQEDDPNIMLRVTVSGGGRTVLFTADLFPFAGHLKPHYVPALDVDPRLTMATRQRHLERIAAEGWLLLFQHDAAHALVQVDANLGVTPVDLA